MKLSAADQVVRGVIGAGAKTRRVVRLEPFPGIGAEGQIGVRVGCREGDVFEVVKNAGKRDESRKQFMLVAQPCEMMVRVDAPLHGKRRPTTIGVRLPWKPSTFPIHPTSPHSPVPC